MMDDRDISMHGGGLLTADQAARVGADMAGLAQAGLPLAPGLRALAGELRGRRTRRALRRLADELDRGAPLDAALARRDSGFPRPLRSLILAGVRTGRLAEVLEEFVSIETKRAEMRRRVWLSLAYPTILVIALCALGAMFGLVIVPQFRKIFDEFGVNLPALTRMVLWTSESGGYISTIVAIALVIASLLVLVLARRLIWAQRLVHALPLLGKVWRWQALAEFSRLMALFLESQTPLPEALRLVGEGVHAADLAIASRRTARRIEAGSPLSESLRESRVFPPSFLPYIDTGVQTCRLPDAFRAAAETFEQRGAVNMTLWEIVIPPFLFVFVLCGVGFLVVGLMMPLISVIQMLS